MSESHEAESWVDRYGLLFVILYGLVFVSILVSFSPKI